MEPNDTQPGGQSGCTITIQLTRDTLMLLAALLFLGVAILLAIFFPPASSSNPTPTASGPSLASSTDAAGVRATVAAATPGALVQATAGGASRPAGGAATPAGYPAPNGVAEQPSAAALPEQRLTTTPPTAQPPTTPASPSELPIFSPSRPTQPAAGGVGGPQQQPYPAPQTPIATFAQPTSVRSSTTQQTSPAISPTDPVFDETETDTPEPSAAATAEPQPTRAPEPAATPRPPQPTPTPAPTAVPVDVLRGTVRWTAAQSPIVLRRDQQVIAGATLIIEPGAEVRLAPGVSIFVDGTVYALGQPNRPVRIVGSERQRWEGIFGRPGANITMEHTHIRGGGAGGTVLLSEGGNLTLHNAHINDNGGHVQVNDSRLELRDSEIAGNDMPYGSALEASYGSGGGVILTNNRIGGNRMQPGTSPVRISNQSTFDTLNLDLRGNLLVGSEGPDIVLSTNGPLLGGLTCNAFVGGTNGLSVRSETPQVPGFALNVRDNATEKHTPPIIPEYLRYGIGRGATSEIALDMRSNWWGSALGPYEPDRHADGRGEAVGDNIEFAPWLTERPTCAPIQ